LVASADAAGLPAVSVGASAAASAAPALPRPTSAAAGPLGLLPSLSLVVPAGAAAGALGSSGARPGSPRGGSAKAAAFEALFAPCAGVFSGPAFAPASGSEAGFLATPISASGASSGGCSIRWVKSSSNDGSAQKPSMSFVLSRRCGLERSLVVEGPGKRGARGMSGELPPISPSGDP
jgi:hypothetical protein